MTKKLVGTVDLTPSWAGSANIIYALLIDGTPDAKKVAKAELDKMARLADRYVKLMKSCKARMSGEWDEQHLKDKGILTPDEGADIYRYVKDDLKTIQI